MSDPTTPSQDTPPETGDPAVDQILRDFDAGGEEDLATRLEAASEAHRRLQQRLTEPGDGPPSGG